MGRKKYNRNGPDLTPEEYIRFKENGLSDKEIAVIADVCRSQIVEFKKKHGIDIRLSARTILNPKTKRGRKRLDELIQKTKDLRRKYWTNEAIAKELGVSMHVIREIIKRYLPEEKRKTPTVFTEEEKEMARRAGVSLRTVSVRLYQGMSRIEALTTPLQRKSTFTKEEMERIKKSGLHRATVYSRVKKGMTLDEALSVMANRKEFKKVKIIIERLELSEMMKAQKELDEITLENNKKTSIEVKTSLEIGLMVEVGEMMNELEKLWKYWKKRYRWNESKILDELADVLHLILSRGVFLEIEPKSEEIYFLKDVSSQLQHFYRAAAVCGDNPVDWHYCMSTFRGLLKHLEITWDQMSAAYWNKHKVNIQRQRANY